MLLSCKIKSFKISASSEKDAYLKGCKELAKYMASRKFQNISFRIERLKEDENTLIFTMYTNIDLGEEQREFCKICKEFHCSFFINEQYNCDRCNLRAFLNKCQEKARISKGFYKKKFDND